MFRYCEIVVITAVTIPVMAVRVVVRLCTSVSGWSRLTGTHLIRPSATGKPTHLPGVFVVYSTPTVKPFLSVLVVIILACDKEFVLAGKSRGVDGGEWNVKRRQKPRALPSPP
jgi:hypothetical protein